MLAENMTQTLTIKRAAVSDGGQRNAFTTIATGVACSPAFPDNSGQLQERLRIATPITLYRSFVAGTPDLRLADTIELGGATYRARGVAAYPENMSANLPAYTELILERVML